MTHEAGNDQPLIAAGGALRAYLDENAAAESDDRVERQVGRFNNTMAELLADSLNRSPNNVVPKGYVVATQLLIHDCKETGKDGITDEPMPGDVTGLPPMMYGIFQGRSVELATEAFGKPFGDAVKEIYSQLKHRAEAKDKEPTDNSQAYEALKQVEGVDPVGAVLDGHPQDIPQEGWAIDARMELGSSTVISVFRYGKGTDFQYSADYKDSRAEYGRGAIQMSMPGSSGSGHYTVLYESPAFPQSQRNKEPYDRRDMASYVPLGFDKVDLTELKNGGRIVDEKNPRAYRGSANLRWTDIDRLADRNDTEVGISRVTGDKETMEKIVSQLGQAMGMDEQGIAALAESVKAKTEKLG